MQSKPVICPECQDTVEINRRDFLRTVGAATAAAAVVPASLLGARPAAAEIPQGSAESLAKVLYESLTAEQKSTVGLALDSPLRSRISANWAVTQPAIKDFFKGEQTELLHGILKGVTSGDGYERFLRQMQDDSGGFGAYHVAFFGTPADPNFQFMMTGRHMTIRTDGKREDKVAFGGPMIYGHGEESSPAKNLFYFQTRRSNEVFGALDGTQRSIALLEKAPPENAVQFREGNYPGLAVGSLTRDQKELVEKVVADLLSPYRKQEVDEVLAMIKSNGGLDKIHLAFYKQEDLGSDSVWDIWRLEGPGFVWHFRGAPHVHTYVNIATR